MWFLCLNTWVDWHSGLQFISWVCSVALIDQSHPFPPSFVRPCNKTCLAVASHICLGWFRASEHSNRRGFPKLGTLQESRDHRASGRVLHSPVKSSSSSQLSKPHGCGKASRTFDWEVSKQVRRSPCETLRPTCSTFELGPKCYLVPRFWLCWMYGLVKWRIGFLSERQSVRAK